MAEYGVTETTAYRGDWGASVSNTANAALPKAGGIMSGPLTNESGFFGNGAGLTNLPPADASAWSAYPATQTVNMAYLDITNIHAVVIGSNVPASVGVPTLFIYSTNSVNPILRLVNDQDYYNSNPFFDVGVMGGTIYYPYLRLTRYGWLQIWYGGIEQSNWSDLKLRAAGDYTTSGAGFITMLGGHNMEQVSGYAYGMKSTFPFKPTSGNANYYGWYFNDAIDQTSTATGMTYGIVINPVLADNSTTQFVGIRVDKGGIIVSNEVTAGLFTGNGYGLTNIPGTLTVAEKAIATNAFRADGSVVMAGTFNVGNNPLYDTGRITIKGPYSEYQLYFYGNNATNCWDFRNRFTGDELDLYCSDRNGNNYSAVEFKTSNFWVRGDCSALTFTDRTPYPDSVEQAKTAINTLAKKSGGSGLDHEKLDPLLRVTRERETATGEKVAENGRDLSMTVSCLAEIAKDLLLEIDSLKSRIVQLEKQ